MASKLCPQGDPCWEVRLYGRVTPLAGQQGQEIANLIKFVELVASRPDRRGRKIFLLTFFCFLFSDCFEDLLEGLDDDDDFLDEALLV